MYIVGPKLLNSEETTENIKKRLNGDRSYQFKMRLPQYAPLSVKNDCPYSTIPYYKRVLFSKHFVSP